MSYPNGQAILSVAECKLLSGVGTTYSDAALTACIASVQDQVELYCDRRFMRYTWSEWYKYDRELLLSQWPVNNILFIGTPAVAVTITDSASSHSFNVVQATGTNPTLVPRLTVSNAFALTSADFLFSTYTTLALLKAAVDVAYPTVTFTITTDATYAWSTMNPLCLRPGTGSTLYGARRQDVPYRIDDGTSRELVIPEDVTVSFQALDWFFESALNIVWDAGYSAADVPQGLKLAVASIVRELMGITKIPSGGNTTRLEVLNYSETFSNTSKTWSLITNEQYGPMLSAYKKMTC